jgi:DNA-binding GntR family transcriptional regulator
MGKVNEDVYAELRRRIMAGLYAPGTQLKEETLGTELNVSRTPVRTALHRLIKEGVLEARANRGAFIARWTDRDIDEVIDLRCMLESHGAALAATHASAEQIDALAELNVRMARLCKSYSAKNIAELQELNNSFHQGILLAAGSPRLRAAAQPLVDWPLVVGTFYIFTQEEVMRSIGYHDDLVLALRAGDPLLARNVMESHLRRSYVLYREKRRHRGRAAPADRTP